MKRLLYEELPRMLLARRKAGMPAASPAESCATREAAGQENERRLPLAGSSPGALRAVGQPRAPAMAATGQKMGHGRGRGAHALLLTRHPISAALPSPASQG